MGKYKWIYQIRNLLASLPVFFAFISNDFEIENEFVIWGVGGVIFLLGIAIRIWAQQHLHYRMGIHKQLTTSGPYRLVRNPLYIANTLSCAGATICSELVWLVPLTLIWAIGVYSIVIRYEEAHLSEKYGDPYRKYLQQVPRWIPRQIGFRHLDLINGYLGRALVVEFPCVLMLLPFAVKEIIR
jgi:protein-S-isoprenylcysteine O-methyltransferase Ste14